MESVVKAYRDTWDRDTGLYSLRAVSGKCGITRAKVRKILITMGELSHPITDRARMLQANGYTIRQIAEELCLSPTTVSTYLPYDTVLYNGAEKSADAIRAQAYRKRVKNKQKNGKTCSS